MLVTEYISGRSLVKTRNQLLIDMGAINGNYPTVQERIVDFSDYTGIDSLTVRDFYSTSNSNLKIALEKALAQLRSKSLVMHEKVNMICTKSKKHREAVANEKELILECESIALKRMGFTKLSEVMFSKQWDQFKKLQKEVLEENNAEFDFSYMAYRITANTKDRLQHEYNHLLDYLLEDDERLMYINQLNDTISKRFLTNASKRSNSAVGKTNPSKINVNRSKKEYVSDFRKMITLLMLKEQESILGGLDQARQKRIDGSRTAFGIDY